MNAAQPKVDSQIQEAPPLTGQVEIKTWANEVIRGRIVREEPDAYVLDVGPKGAPDPTIRRVARSVVMDLRVVDAR